MLESLKSMNGLLKRSTSVFSYMATSKLKRLRSNNMICTQKLKSSIHQNEMIKVIDHTGQVLVLRHDVTIPITRKIAEDFSRTSN